MRYDCQGTGSEFGKDSCYLDKKMGMVPCLGSMSTWSLSSSDTKILCGRESSSVGLSISQATFGGKKEEH